MTWLAHRLLCYVQGAFLENLGEVCERLKSLTETGLFFPTIKSPEKDTRQMDLGTAPDGFLTRQMEILKKDRAMWESKIHPARCFQLARDLHWTGPKK